jgi:hypothetical protein
LPSDGRFRTWNCPKGAFKSSSTMPIAIPPWCAPPNWHNPHGHPPHAPPARSGDLASQDAFRPLGSPAEQAKPNRFTGTSSGTHQPEDAIDLRLRGRDAAAAPTFMDHACAGPSLGFCFTSGRTAGFITRRFNTLFRLRCGWPLNSAPSRVRCRAPQ